MIVFPSTDRRNRAKVAEDLPTIEHVFLGRKRANVVNHQGQAAWPFAIADHSHVFCASVIVKRPHQDVARGVACASLLCFDLTGQNSGVGFEPDKERGSATMIDAGISTLATTFVCSRTT